MKRYYEIEAESDYGVGLAYVEFDGRWVIRQIEFYEETVHWAAVTGDSGPWPERVTTSGPGAGICDQPFEVLGMDDKNEISQSRFEEKWTEARELTANRQ